MSTDRKSFMDSLTIMAETFKGLSGVMVGHGGHSEVARQHERQFKTAEDFFESGRELARELDKKNKNHAVTDEYSPYNTVNS